MSPYQSVRIDGLPRPCSEPVTRIDTWTGPHLLRVIAEEEDEDRELAEVRFEIPDGLRSYSLEVTAPAAEETARADPPR